MLRPHFQVPLTKWPENMSPFFATRVHSSSSLYYNPLWSSSPTVHRVCLSSCLLLIVSCSLQSDAGVVVCDSSSASRPPLVSSFNDCRASVVLSVCCCDSTTLIQTDSFSLSSLLPVSVSGLCGTLSSLLPVSIPESCEPLSRHGCLRMVRLCLLRRDWLQCRVRLRCH